MKHNKIRKKYDNLELEVFVALCSEIEKSNYISEFVEEKAIKVNLFDYKELSRINERLVFLDHRGHQHSVYSECSLEDLVDILNS